MKKIAILGSTGMIGLGVTRRLTELGHSISEFNRAGISVTGSNPAFRLNLNSQLDSKEFDRFKGFDFLINAVGVIRHKINELDPDQVENAININGVFPQELNHFGSRNSIHIIQIGTDCVFSGSKGSYLETDVFDPVDFYGESKVLGETNLDSTMNLRVSVVGKELATKIELLEWVLHREPDSDVNGYVNHIWSGATPFQLAQIIDGIVRRDLFRSGTQHLVPSNKVSKFELVKMIAEYQPESRLKIHEMETAISVDRSLGTVNILNNQSLWANAGYDQPPSIQDMLREYMEWTGTVCSH
jgi:dTDP-4-dehydrorhamnose reductase